jgi:hypothetical protein
MRIGAAIFAVVVAVGSIAGAIAASAGEKETESWLFVLDATSATADGDRLTLVGVDPISVAFTDRPRRLVARVQTSGLSRTWDDAGFAEDPPNAAVSWFDDDGEHSVVVVLSDPQPAADDLSFAYRVIEKNPKRLRSHTADPQPDLPAELRDVVVFVDARPIIINSQMTD